MEQSTAEHLERLSASRGGMAEWWVSEPVINLWVKDNPLWYQPSRGPAVSLDLYFKQLQAGIPETENTSTNIFTFGRRWHSPWRAYVYIDDQGFPTNYWVVLGDGSVQTNRLGSVEYNTRTLLQYDGTGTNLVLEFPSGAKNIYGFKVTDPETNIRMFLTQSIDPNGHTTAFQYLTTNNVTRLVKIVDVDTKETTFTYTNKASYDLVAQVTDPFGHTAVLSYDASGYLTNVTDVVSLSSGFGYTNTTTLNCLTTPYGTTTFVRFSTDDYEAVAINELGLRRHFYLWNASELDGKIPTNYTADVPTTTNGSYFAIANSFDTTTSNERNTFYWNPKQYSLLSANARTNIENGSFSLSSVSSDDYKLCRLRHWLELGSSAAVSRTLSLERQPSPDGSTQGQLVWYDYSNKASGNAKKEGTLKLPRLVAWKLSSGESRFTYYDRNSSGNATNVVQTYSDSAGTLRVRTNQFEYATNGVDLIRHIQVLGATTRQASSNAYNANHQVIMNFNALNEKTTYLYDGSQRLVSTQRPSGWVTTNTYDSDGRLSTTIDKDSAQSYRTNAYSWTNGLIYIFTDPRGLRLTNTWDALGRLTQTTFPDLTSIRYEYERLDRVRAIDRLGFTNHSEFNGFRKITRTIDALNRTNTFTYCDCGTLSSVTDPLGNTTAFTYDNLGRRTQIAYADGMTVSFVYDLTSRLSITTDSAGAIYPRINNSTRIS